MSTVLGLTV